MKNLLNCHSVGLHSFPISLENGVYRRVFYADSNHNLWKTDPLEIAIHPHHVDIKITVLDGVLYNMLYEEDKDGEMFMAFRWNSVILNGKGGFEKTGKAPLSVAGARGYRAGETTYMKACELHTVYVEKGEKAVWLIEESVPTCEYFPVNYSNRDLSSWRPEGLYVETDDRTKEKFIGRYRDMF